MKNTVPFERGDWVALHLNVNLAGHFIGQIVGTSEIRGVRMTVHVAANGKDITRPPCVGEDYVFPWSSVAFMRHLPDGQPKWCKCGETS
jgi:hypothetical protein